MPFYQFGKFRFIVLFDKSIVIPRWGGETPPAGRETRPLRIDKPEFGCGGRYNKFTIFTKFHPHKNFLCEYYEKLNFLHFLGCFYGTFCIQ